MTQKAKTVNFKEIGQIAEGYTVENGEKTDTSDPVLKKLEFLQQKILEIEEKVEKIENNTRKAGGAQPQGKFTTSVLHTEKAGQKVLSDLGKEIKYAVDDQGELTKNQFKKILRTHEWTASTETTYRNWMEKVAAHFDAFGFEVGERGGSNKPSRIVYEGVE